MGGTGTYQYSQSSSKPWCESYLASWFCSIIGVKGIMLAALLAALMSSLTSVFNSSSTVFTMDIWRRIRAKAPESELMVVGRFYTIFLVFVSIFWLPVLEALQGSQFWDYTQSINSYILPPIVMTYLIGLFWLRATEKVKSLKLLIVMLLDLTTNATNLLSLNLPYFMPK